LPHTYCSGAQASYLCSCLSQLAPLISPSDRARAEPAHYATALKNHRGNFGNLLENLSVAISLPGPTFAFRQINRECSLAGYEDEKGAHANNSSDEAASFPAIA
jgi:hypothetical protein